MIPAELVVERLAGLARRPGRAWWKAAHRLERLTRRAANRRAWRALMSCNEIGMIYGVRWLVSKRKRRRPTRGPEPWRRLPR